MIRDERAVEIAESHKGVELNLRRDIRCCLEGVGVGVIECPRRAHLRLHGRDMPPEAVGRTGHVGNQFLPMLRKAYIRMEEKKVNQIT